MGDASTMDVDRQNASVYTKQEQEQTNVLTDARMSNDSPTAIHMTGESDARMLLDDNSDGQRRSDCETGQRSVEGNSSVTNSAKKEQEEKEEKEENEGKVRGEEEEDDGDHDFDESANEETRLQLLSASVRDQDELERMVGRQVGVLLTNCDHENGLTECAG